MVTWAVGVCAKCAQSVLSNGASLINSDYFECTTDHRSNTDGSRWYIFDGFPASWILLPCSLDVSLMSRTWCIPASCTFSSSLMDTISLSLGSLVMSHGCSGPPCALHPPIFPKRFSNMSTPQKYLRLSPADAWPNACGLVCSSVGRFGEACAKYGGQRPSASPFMQ